MSIISYEFKTRVRYKDTDQMGIMHHANYIVLYEMARTEWLRDLGLPYAELERRGIMSPIIEVNLKYMGPAFYDEVLTVKVMMDEMPSARLVIPTEIYNEQGKLINKGSVTLGFINAETRRPCRAPEWLIEAINREIEKTSNQ